MIKLGASFWWITGLAILSFTVSRLPGFSDNLLFLRLSFTLAILLLANLIFSIFAITRIDIRRSSRTPRMQVGEIFSERFEIVNHHFLPKAWIKIKDLSQYAGLSGSRVLTRIAPHQVKTYQAFSLLERRGEFALGPTRLETGDLLGTFLFSREFPAHGSIMIVPYIVPIQHFPAPSGILAGGRDQHQKTLSVTPYVAGVREYVPGDPLKRVHWPSSARKQKLIVKEFEKDPQAEVWILLDARRSVHFSLPAENLTPSDTFLWLRKRKSFKLPPNTEEYAITTAASLAAYYLKQKREVGFAAAGQKYTVLTPERGERQLGKLLETLAILRMEGELPFMGLVESQYHHLSRGSTVILITPAVKEDLLQAASNLIRKGCTPVIVLIDTRGFGGGEDPDPIASQLLAHGILTYTLREGIDLGLTLSARVTHQEKFMRQSS